MKAKYIGIVLLAGGMLAGCGGGSSGTTATSTPSASKVSISATNADAVTKSAISTASQSIGGGYASFVGGVQTSTSSNNDRVLFNAADFALQQMAQHQNAPASVSGAVTTTACAGGGGNYSVDTDGTSSTTATYYKVTYNNCVAIASDPTTLNGSINITNISRTSTTALSATIDFNFTATTSGNPAFSLVGGFAISATGMGTTLRTDTLSGASIVASAGTASMSLTNFSFISARNTGITPATETETINYTVGIIDSANPASNFLFSFATTQNMVTSGTDTYPSSGQFVVTGDASTALRVTFLPTIGTNIAGTASGQIKLELSTDGGVNWGTPIIKTWATL